MSHTVIIGSSFAGLTAAFELRSILPQTEKITVISANKFFYFFPSLIWVIQGNRELDDISFSVRPVLQEIGVEFIHAQLVNIDPHDNTVFLSDKQTIHFDKLLIATGGEWAWDILPGLHPKPYGHTVSMLTPLEALKARAYWRLFMKNPGPVVIGATKGASLFGAAYEFILNLEVAFRRAGIRQQTMMMFVTPEPFLGHFGHGGIGNSRQILEQAFSKRKIYSITEAEIERVEPDAVILTSQRRLDSTFTMIVPPYRGIKQVRQVPDLTNEMGRVLIDDYYRTLNYPHIFAAGIAVHVDQVEETTVPCGILVTGTVSAEMGRVAAHNIAADLGYRDPLARPLDALKAFYVLDSRSHGLFMSLGSKAWLNLQANVPGPWSHWAKIITEKYQLWQLETGRF